MARVTQSEVEAILPNPDSLDLTAFITAANLLVTKKLSGAGLGDSTLKNIELFIAAHFATALIRRTSREKIGEAEMEFQAGDLGLFLKSTDYGQTALTLDTSGLLAAAGQLPYLLHAI